MRNSKCSGWKWGNVYNIWVESDTIRSTFFWGFSVYFSSFFFFKKKEKSVNPKIEKNQNPKTHNWNRFLDRCILQLYKAMVWLLLEEHSLHLFVPSSVLYCRLFWVVESRIVLFRIPYLSSLTLTDLSLLLFFPLGMRLI